ncbi:hypothetical protein [uncultured Erythrobacter sp.]|uniref:hypothetical protein n=1 Tax=uncultured Erythrobacter sp. TaxID=263913 RepID=UPI00265B0B0F|nr:hypothetical protein [uncultured Erythrobacter sp.]
MGRTMIAALIAMGMLTGCTDWREGSETVEACLKRLAPKKDVVDPLHNSPHQWVPSYTYDVTKLAPEALRSLIKVSQTKGQTEGITVLEGSSSQKARDDFHDRPATKEGLLLIADDPALYKVRGRPGLYRELIRQGCDGQRAGMRLINWSAARADLMVDDKFPSGPTAAEIRAVQELDRPKIKDLIP